MKGDWYTGSFSYPFLDSINKKDFINFSYEEIFLTDSTIFTFSNVAGFRIPYTYKIEKDSLLSGIGMRSRIDFDYRGKIVLVDENHFKLINKEKLEANFFRLENVENTLSKFIVNKNSQFPSFEQKGTSYSQGFINRNQKYYSKQK